MKTLVYGTTVTVAEPKDTMNNSSVMKLNQETTLTINKRKNGRENYDPEDVKLKSTPCNSAFVNIEGHPFARARARVR